MGIIRVPYEDRFGSLDQVDFYYGTILASNKLNRYYDFQDFPKGEKAVYGGQSKVVLAGINGKGPKLKYTTYCIGYRQDINECYKVIENLLSAQ